MDNIIAKNSAYIYEIRCKRYNIRIGILESCRTSHPSLTNIYFIPYFWAQITNINLYLHSKSRIFLPKFNSSTKHIFLPTPTIFFHPFFSTYNSYFYVCQSLWIRPCWVISYFLGWQIQEIRIYGLFYLYLGMAEGLLLKSWFISKIF